jgi:transcription antitermination protein NusB
MSNDKQNAHHNAKRLARLAAVQALYQMTLIPRPAEQVIREFRSHPQALLQETGEDGASPEVDHALFGAIVTGVTAGTEELDGMIAGAFDSKSSAERLEILLRAILRAGVYELYHQGAIPTGVIINDYVDVTHAFFGDKEPGLVNGILDKLAKGLRAA